MKVIFGTGNRVSQRCSKNPKMRSPVLPGVPRWPSAPQRPVPASFLHWHGTRVERGAVLDTMVNPADLSQFNDLPVRRS